MANNMYVYQQAHTVSIPRNSLLTLAKTNMLSIEDYKVLMVLLTQLDGYPCAEEMTNTRKNKDPKNYKKIDIKQIADTLDMKKKTVKECINNIYNTEIEGFGYILDQGDNDVVKNGYRFTF